MILTIEKEGATVLCQRLFSDRQSRCLPLQLHLLEFWKDGQKFDRVVFFIDID